MAVVSHRNAGKVVLPEEVKALVDPKVGRPLQALQDDQVHYHGQPIAVVVADTFERATHAATLVRATYEETKAVLDFEDAAAKRFTPHEMKADRGKAKSPDYQRGEPDKAFDSAVVKVEETYSQPDEHHNAMELHATLAAWDGNKLTLHDKTQWVDNVQQQVAAAFAINKDDVRVVSPFVGGAFGSALRAWVHVFIAALAAKHARRPVKLVLTRAQQYTVPGYRPRTVQKVALGATRDGKLTAIRHEATAQTSTFEEYTESTLNPTRFLYACPNVATRYYLAAMNVNTPASMRSSGEATGMYALECALDELAYALKMDPLQPAPGQPRRRGPGEALAVVEQVAQAVLPTSGGEIRLGAAQAGAAVDARRPAAGRLGHGDGDVADTSPPGDGVGAGAGRRQAQRCGRPPATSGRAPTRQ